MRVVEIFCCSGGMSEGLRRAGLDVTEAYDFDADACDSHEANLGLRPVQIDVRDLLRMLAGGASLGLVDLLVADPPCTPWSRAGKRGGLADERDMLEATVDLVRRVRPFAWLIANVPGLDDGPNWPIVQRTIGGLTAEGYCIDFARLDAADYGTPQHRVRPFWYGHRRDTGHGGTPCIRWPARTHGSPTETSATTLPGFDPLRPWVTCRQALGHLSADDLGTPVRLRWRGPRPGREPGTKARASDIDEPARVVTTRQNGDGNTLADGPNHRPSSLDAPARTLTRNTHGDGALLAPERHPPNTLDAPSATVTARGEGLGSRVLLVHPRHPVSTVDAPSRTITAKGEGIQSARLMHVPNSHPISRPDEPSHVVPASQPGNGGAVVEWPWERPSTVVTTGDRLAPPGHHGKSFLSDNCGHGPNAIKLSEKAGAILQGFPSGWTFAGATKKARWAQIGMAMPPPLAEAVGRSIAEQLGVRAKNDRGHDAA